ncbi:MAG: hypothetical protein ACW99H_09495, partial [Candidatus Thorarchaeota archaeon]
MTISQIPEQISWNREYQMPLVATFSFIDFWSQSADFSGMNPPFSTMTAIADDFFPWLNKITGISNVDNVITFAPYYGPGETLPPTFERALIGKAETGRYSSIDTSATLVQVMRSILRVPLASTVGRSHEALGSYLVYSYGDQVMDNSRSYEVIDNSNDFSPMMSSAGLTPVMQVGPSTISELASAPYAWVATVHGGVGDELYKDDGRVALFSNDAWRAYDPGRSPSSPDADTEESPRYIVSPSDAYMDVYNVSQLVEGENLRGMFAFLDSCQLGSSYGPSTLMESGADAILACRTDCLVGPADMFEYNVIDSMVYDQETLGDALNSAYDRNSHRYALHDSGLDTYVTTSTADVIGASCLQFTIFGDPDITLYDWTTTPFPVTDRFTGVGPVGTAYGYPGSTYQLPLGMHDPVGNIYASEGAYNINVFDTEDNLLMSGTAICTNLEVGVFEIQFFSASTLGTYDIEIHDMNTNDTFYTQIVLEWPSLVIHSIESSSYIELGAWNLEITLYNPQDVVAETTVQVSLNNDILLISDATWVPGYSSNDFELVLMFGHSGSQTLNVIITMGTQATECCNYDTLVLVQGHWVTPVLWYLIPALSVFVIVIGAYTRRIGLRVLSLQRGMQAEIDGDHETAFDIYGKNRLTRAATRVAVKEDLPEEMMEALMHYYGNIIFNDLQAIANTSVSNGDFRNAAKIFLILGNNEKGLQFRAIAELEDGEIDEAVQTLHELLSANIPGYAVNVITHVKSMNESIRHKFVASAKDDILSLASRIQTDSPSQLVLLSIVEGHVEDEYLVGLLVNLGKVDAASERILALKTIPKLIKISKTLDESHRNQVAPVVIRALIQTYKLKQVAKYITSIDINDKVKEEVVAPLIEQLIQEPSNKDRITALELISKSSSTGSLRVIDEAIASVKTIIDSAKKMGVSVEHIKSSALVPVIAGLKDRVLAEKLLVQTEKQLLSGSVPASAKIEALADFVYSLRASVYSIENVLPQVKLRLSSYEGTLQHRLSQAVHEVFITSTFKADGENWLEVSSDGVAEAIVSGIPLMDSISAVIACNRAMDNINPRQVS